jgi:hypothetical protein
LGDFHPGGLESAGGHLHALAPEDPRTHRAGPTGIAGARIEIVDAHLQARRYR